jgi:hypothetical protein
LPLVKSSIIPNTLRGVPPETELSLSETGETGKYWLSKAGIAELDCGIGIAEGEIDETHDIKNIRVPRAVDVRPLRYGALQERIRFRWSVPKCNIHTLDDIENIDVAIADWIRVAGAEAVCVEWAMTDAVTVNTLGTGVSMELSRAAYRAQLRLTVVVEVHRIPADCRGVK